jgi:hypothetical protein
VAFARLPAPIFRTFDSLSSLKMANFVDSAASMAEPALSIIFAGSREFNLGNIFNKLLFFTTI